MLCAKIFRNRFKFNLGLFKIKLLTFFQTH